MISGVNQIVGRFIVIVFMVASMTFGGLTRLQQQHEPAPIAGGLIRDDVTIEQLDTYIQQLPNIHSNTIHTQTGVIFGPDTPDNNSETDNTIKPDSNPTPDKTQQPPAQASNNLNLDTMVDEIISNQDNHPAAEDYHTKLSQLCDTYQSICTITNLDGNYSDQQSYNYQVMVIFMAQKLANRGYDPLTTLRSLTINNYNKTKRGYANARLMVLNTYQMASHKEFLQVLSHEMGHVIDLGVVVGNSRQIHQNYTEFGKAKFPVDDPSLIFYAISWLNEDTMRANMQNADFVSGYGMTNPFEDFAESHNMYLYHREVFAYLASTNRALQQKYNYFDNLYQSNYLSLNFNPTSLSTLDTTMRPWDTTRM